MENREIRTLLWNSVDAVFHRRTLAVGVGVLCLCGIACGILFSLSADTAWFMLAAGLAVVLPLLLWRLGKLLRIFRNPEGYVLFRTILSAPKGNNKAVAFPVFCPDGKQRWTDRIYYIRKHEPLLSDWLDQSVTIAWNRKTDTVVVIGK